MNYFSIIFEVLFIGAFILSIVFMIKNFREQARAPKLVVNAEVISKRDKVSGRKSGSTHFYLVTFKIDGGDNVELFVDDSVYYQLEIGYEGKLTFKGKRYLDFEME